MCIFEFLLFFFLQDDVSCIRCKLNQRSRNGNSAKSITEYDDSAASLLKVLFENSHFARGCRNIDGWENVTNHNDFGTVISTFKQRNAIEKTQGECVFFLKGVQKGCVIFEMVGRPTDCAIAQVIKSSFVCLFKIQTAL